MRYVKIVLPILIMVVLSIVNVPVYSDESFFKLVAIGTPKQIRSAIRRGAEVNARSVNGWTPLMVAAAYNYDSEVTKVLLKAGAEVTVRSEDQWTPLMFAAAYNNNPLVIWLLLLAGAGVDVRTVEGGSPLMVAAAYNSNPLMIRLLLSAGANVNIRGENGVTPLMMAARFNQNPQVIIALLDHGVDVKEEDFDGKTVFDYVILNNHIKRIDAYLRLIKSQFQVGTKYNYHDLLTDIPGGEMRKIAVVNRKGNVKDSI